MRASSFERPNAALPPSHYSASQQPAFGRSREPSSPEKSCSTLTQAVLLLALTACGGEKIAILPGTERENLFVGTFQLQAIDGGGLPATFPPVGAPVEITRGTLVIRPDGRFVLTDVLRNVPSASGGVRSDESGGTYQITDLDISLIFENRVVTGGLNGDVLTLHRGAPTFVYRR